MSNGALRYTPRHRSGTEQDLKILRLLRVTDPNKVGTTEPVLSLHQENALYSSHAFAGYIRVLQVRIITILKLFKA